ncbi:MAG TPA: ABC transporter permease [Bauldia sp.]|nr:ABC transporter permease [Bauldia sp.]
MTLASRNRSWFRKVLPSGKERRRRTGQRLALYVVRRCANGALTLWILSACVFFLGQVLPGSPGLAILGASATPEAVDTLNRSLGYDRPVVVRYLDWLQGALHGDFGESVIYGLPVSQLLGAAAFNSIKLCIVALVVILPLSLFGGISTGVFRGSVWDRVVTMFAMSVMVVPEFVTGIVLIVVFAIKIPLFPVAATAAPDAGFLSTLYHLILPSIALAAVLFGYVARVARAGTIEAFEADYTRTAFVKGLSTSRVVIGHVVPNAVLPAVMVIATQVGYLFGGLVVIERLFNYPGLGLLIFQAAAHKDFPTLQASALVIGCTYIVMTLVADLLQMTLNPRVRSEVLSQ